MATLGTLVTNVIAKTKGFESGMKRASTSTTKFGAATAGARKKLAGLGAGLLSGLGLVAFVAGIKSAFTAIDTLAKTSDSLGITTEKLAGLRFAAEQTGLSTEGLDKALSKMVRSVGEAERGTGVAKDAFKELGLSAEELGQLTPDQQFLAISDAISKTKTSTDKATLSYQIFGRQGVALVNTLELGADGLNEFQMEAEAAGIAVSRIDAAAIEKANDSINKAKQSVKGLGNSIAVILAPTLDALGRSFSFVATGQDEAFGPAARTRIIEVKNEIVKLEEANRKLRRDGVGIFESSTIKQNEAALKLLTAELGKFNDEQRRAAELSKKRAEERRAAAIQAEKDAESLAIRRSIDTKEARFLAEIEKEILKVRGEAGLTARIAAFETELQAKGAPEAIIGNIKQQQKELLKLRKTRRENQEIFDDETERIRRRAKVNQELAAQARVLRKSLRTPFDDARISIEKWLELLERGSISQKTFDKATQKLLKDFAPEQEAVTGAAEKGTRLVGAIGRNTLAEASFLNKQKFGDKGTDPADRVIKKHDEEIKELREQKALLAEIVENSKQQFTVVKRT